jgi:hypothetical protein
MTGWGSAEKAYEMETPTEYPELKCSKCGRIGDNYIDEDVPVRGHPNVTTKWLVCKCGSDIMEIEE